jgi:BirA family biotin operon repressor/biotin-[acetyl-CoA-carboxylase] ligase
MRVEVVDRAPSTNAALAALARAGEDEGLVLVAEHQTAGRGRLDRGWETPARAALTFSLLLRPPVAEARWPWLPLLAGVGIVEGLTAYGAPTCDLKWPNDVMCGGRKVAGILAERVEGPYGGAVVVGVGLNVSTTRAELPLAAATSLTLEGMADPDRTELLRALLDGLAARYLGWSTGEEGGVEVAEAYRRLCRTLGQEVQVQLPAGDLLTGTATALGTTGGLVVTGPAGAVTVSAGDVVHVRPANPGGGP